jgi:hypothetical protein
VTFAATAGTRRQAHDSEDRRIAAALHVEPHRIDIWVSMKNRYSAAVTATKRPGCHPADGIVALRR